MRYIENENVRKVIDILLMSAAVCYMIVALLDYETVFTQSELDVFYARATCALSFLIFLLKKVNPFNWQSLVATIAMFILYCFYASPYQGSPLLVTAARYGGVTQWLVLLIVIDTLHQKQPFLEGCRKGPFFLYATTAFFILYYRMNRKEFLILVVPLLLLFTIRVKKEEWNRFLLSLYYGCIGAFCITIWKSLQYADISSADRWYGYFPTLATFGFFLSCCFLLSLWVFWVALRQSKTCKTPLFFVNCAWMAAILVFALVIVGTRTFYLVLVGEAVVLACLFWKQIPKWAKLGALFLIVFCVVALTGVTIYFKTYSEEQLLQLIQSINEKYGENGITYFVRTFLRFFLPQQGLNDSFTGFWGLVNAFTGQRLIITKAFLDEVSFQPNGIVGVYIGDYFPGHAHNTVVQMAYQFGIPTAIFYTSFFFCGLVNRIRAYRRNHEAYNLLPILWIVMMLTTWITETVIVCSVMTIIGLITMYPFVVNLDD